MPTPTDRWIARWNAALSRKEWHRRGQTEVVIGDGFGTDPPPPPPSTMMMGCSTSNNDHGGTEVWEGWRTYNRSTLYQYVNRTGSLKPKFMAYSESGANLGDSSPNYNTIYQHVRDELDIFYYGSVGSNTPNSQRQDIKLYWSNGNENQDKGILGPDQRLTPVSQAAVDGYVTSQRALYEAVHYAPGGSRRYPNAFAGSNPTQNAEQRDIVAQWLHPSAQYHDFVMWSMYPPGRQNTEADPTFNWPSYVEANRTNLTLGYLIRCFYRTAQARAAARTALGNPNFPMLIGCGEIGIGDDPDDGTTRPYYAVHALAEGMLTLSSQYQLEMPFACWWDNQDGATAPQNILTDEPSGLQVSTRMAWQNHLQYNHLRGGTHPSSWAGNPKPGWKTSGPVQ